MRAFLFAVAILTGALAWVLSSEAATAQTITKFPVGNTGTISGAVAGPDGNVWLTAASNQLFKVTPGGAISSFPTPTSGSSPYGITVGPDGNIWFTEHNTSKIGRIALPSGTVTEFTIPTNNSAPWGIAAGADGSLWFTERLGNKIGRITTTGAITEFSLPAGVVMPFSIAAGPDGNIWFTAVSTVGRITSAGVITTYAAPVQQSWFMVAGPDGNLWYTDISANRIGRIDMAGSVVEFSIPTASSQPKGIAPGPDGNLWFAEFSTDKLGIITPNGSITEFDLGTNDVGGPQPVVRGADNNIWVGSWRSGSGAFYFQVSRVVPVSQSPLPGAIFSSAQTTSQSFLRFHNTGTTAGTVTLALRNNVTGASIGQWTTPSIPAGSEQQYSIGSIESALGSFTKPSYYSVAMQTNISGHFQHVLWRPADGTLTNLSTCASGVTADRTQLSGVHSTLVGTGYPSTVVVNNTGAGPAAVALGVYDAGSGTKLGTYTTASIPAKGQALLSVATIESSVGFSPSDGMYHYVIKTEGAFTGFLQHLVNNVQVGVITDMTTSCSLGGSSTVASSPQRLGAIYSTSQAASQSFLRFHNTSATAGTVTVTVHDGATGSALGQWTSPSIAAGSEQQYAIGTIEAALGDFTRPPFYSIEMQSKIGGYFQHVLWRPADGTLTNLSTCAAGVVADRTQISGVHSSLVGSGYPSTIGVNNTGTAAMVATLGVYDARNGTRLGGFSTASIPPNGQFFYSMAVIQSVAGITPTTGMFHYVIKAEGAFTGFLQHLVSNVQAGVVTDMTTSCGLP